MTTDRANGLRELCEAFNERDLDAVLAATARDAAWPNGSCPALKLAIER